MKYLLLWSNKDGNYWFETNDINELQDPLEQIYNLHKGKKNGTSSPKVFKGTQQHLTPVMKTVKNEAGMKRQVLDKFQIQDV